MYFFVRSICAFLPNDVKKRINLNLISMHRNGYNDMKGGLHMNELQMKIMYYKRTLHLTNDDIHAVTGLPTATISRICTGKTADPKLGTLRLLAKAFDCSVDDLLGTADGVEPFYLDRTTGTLALALKENPDLRYLIELTKDLSPENLQTFIGIVNILLKRN